MPLLPEVHLPRLTGQMLSDVVQRKGVTAGCLDGWGWREFKVLPLSWYDELARILTKVVMRFCFNESWASWLVSSCLFLVPCSCSVAF